MSLRLLMLQFASHQHLVKVIQDITLHSRLMLATLIVGIVRPTLRTTAHLWTFN